MALGERGTAALRPPHLPPRPAAARSRGRGVCSAASQIAVAHMLAAPLWGPRSSWAGSSRFPELPPRPKTSWPNEHVRLSLTDAVIVIVIARRPCGILGSSSAASDSQEVHASRDAAGFALFNANERSWLG